MPNTSDRKVDRLVIDRPTWGTGQLLDHNGNKCCLGFLAIKCGADETEIDGEMSPANVPNINWPAAFTGVATYKNKKGVKRYLKNSELADKMMSINDDEEMKWADKERELIPLFKKAGIKLSFKGPSKDKL